MAWGAQWMEQGASFTSHEGDWDMCPVGVVRNMSASLGEWVSICFIIYLFEGGDYQLMVLRLCERP